MTEMHRPVTRISRTLAPLRVQAWTPIWALVAAALVAFPAPAAFAQPAPTNGPAAGPAISDRDTTPAEAGPAGNAHPDAPSVSADAAGLENPFGPPPRASLGTVTQKLLFARSLDLEPLRDLAVFHGTRVKILDTLARETVLTLTGRAKLGLPAADPDTGDVIKAEFDPLFTLLDTMIDPGFYAMRPLIGVDYLPLRDAYLLAEFPDDADTRAEYRRLTRVNPITVDRYSQAIYEAYAGRPQFVENINRVERQLRLFLGSPSNLFVIAPESDADPWHHLSEWPESSEVRLAAAALGASWRAADTEGVNAAAARLAEALPRINAAQYPGDRRALELAYNRSNAFDWGMWLYAFSLIALVLAFGTGRRWLSATGVALLAGAIGIHGAGFVARCLVAERFAIQNQFESMVGLSLFASAAGAVLMLVRKQPLFAAAASGVGFLVLIAASQDVIPGKSIDREAAILNTSVLLKYHVTTVLTSYGLITLGFIISCFYLAAHYGAKLFGTSDAQRLAAASVAFPSAPTAAGTDAPAADRPAAPTNARLLADLDTAQLVVLQLAFWTLGVGILLGAWWADHSWGRWWAFDPKETWALITWIVYLVVIHVRVGGGGKKGLVTAWLSLAGFFVMAWTYLGVNLLLPGLHAYA